MMYSLIVSVAVVALHDTQNCPLPHVRLTDILYGFSKQNASIWSLSLQILNYIYWNMTYCALSLYLNCILCCYPFSCLVNTCTDCGFKNKNCTIRTLGSLWCHALKCQLDIRKVLNCGASPGRDRLPRFDYSQLRHWWHWNLHCSHCLQEAPGFLMDIFSRCTKSAPSHSGCFPWGSMQVLLAVGYLCIAAQMYVNRTTCVAGMFSGAQLLLLLKSSSNVGVVHTSP